MQKKNMINNFDKCYYNIIQEQDDSDSIQDDSNSIQDVLDKYREIQAKLRSYQELYESLIYKINKMKDAYFGGQPLDVIAGSPPDTIDPQQRSRTAFQGKTYVP